MDAKGHDAKPGRGPTAFAEVTVPSAAAGHASTGAAVPPLPTGAEPPRRAPERDVVRNESWDRNRAGQRAQAGHRTPHAAAPLTVGGSAVALIPLSAALVLLGGAFVIAHCFFSSLSSQVVVNESPDRFADI